MARRRLRRSLQDEKRTALEAALDEVGTCYDMRNAMDPKPTDELAREVLPVLQRMGYDIVKDDHV
jgi:hypothetical protein